MNRFTEAVAGVLEVAEIALDDEFRAVPEWCSLKAFGLLVMLENDFAAPIDILRLQQLKTVRDLYREAFLAFAAELLKVPRAALSGASAMNSLPEWDSVAHLRLVMEAEKRFGVSYPFERIPSLRTIDDFLI